VGNVHEEKRVQGLKYSTLDTFRGNDQGESTTRLTVSLLLS